MLVYNFPLFDTLYLILSTQKASVISFDCRSSHIHHKFPIAGTFGRDDGFVQNNSCCPSEDLNFHTAQGLTNHQLLLVPSIFSFLYMLPRPLI